MVKKNADYHDPRQCDTAEQQELIKYCAVHRTASEKLLWEKFQTLHEEVDQLEGNRVRQHRTKGIRAIAGAFNLTSAECAMKYKQWSKRQRMCDRRKLDRVINKDSQKRLSTWRKLLQGDWNTENGQVTFVIRTIKGRKELEWRSVREGKVIKRQLRVRRKQKRQEWIVAMSIRTCRWFKQAGVH